MDATQTRTWTGSSSSTTVASGLVGRDAARSHNRWTKRYRRANKMADNELVMANEMDDGLNDMSDLVSSIAFSTRAQDMSILRRQHAISPTLDTAIRNRDFPALHTALYNTSPDVMILHGEAEFSGMEWSVFTGDWEMLLVFYFAGADSATHWFRGVARSIPPRATWVFFGCIHAAKQSPTTENSGFNRLWTMVGDIIRFNDGEATLASTKVQAAIWLLARLPNGMLETDLVADNAVVSAVQSRVHLLNPSFDWDAVFADPVAELKETIGVLGGDMELPTMIVDQMAALSIQDLLLRTFRRSLEEVVANITTSE